MLINFYLYKRKAHANPVIEIRRDRNQQEFISILNSLNDLFENGKNMAFGMDYRMKSDPKNN